MINDEISADVLIGDFSQLLPAFSIAVPLKQVTFFACFYLR